MQSESNQIKLLCIGHRYPEPETTAAGRHLIDYLLFLKSANFNVHFASTSKKTPYSFDLNAHQIQTTAIQLNCSSFQDFIGELNPEVVVFDRINSFEQFAWQCKEVLPNVLLVLNTEDLHFLRFARQKQTPYKAQALFHRELKAILSADLSLIISTSEIEILTKDLNVSAEQLAYIPFLKQTDFSNSLGFEQRAHLIFVGNGQHKPNSDAVAYLKDELWPILKEKLPETELHVYGRDYPKTLLMHMPERMHYKGWTKDIYKTMSSYKLNLAPLRFGAGLKGKVMTGLETRTATIGSEIAFEGFPKELQEQAYTNQDQFISKIAELYSNAALNAGYVKIQNNCLSSFSSNWYKEHVKQLHYLITFKEAHRTKHVLIDLLWENQLNKDKYFSKYIQYKQLYNDIKNGLENG